MKIAAIALATALLFAPPALAGPDGPDGPDTDSDGHADFKDNCSAAPNPTQTDNDSDGYGDICDYDNDNLCAGTDFLILGSWFGQSVPPAPADVDQDDNGIIDGGDFLSFGAGFGQPPGTSCGHPKGTPCP